MVGQRILISEPLERDTLPKGCPNIRRGSEMYFGGNIVGSVCLNRAGCDRCSLSLLVVLKDDIKYNGVDKF